MAEAFNLLRRVKSFDISPEQPAYSGVVIFAGQDEEGNNIEYSAGDRTGTVLEITNEWGSQAQADAIYQKIRGFQYQPYRATGSQLDPSVEIGDAVTIKDTYGGVFKKTTSFGRYASTDIEAPSKEEVEHEFQIQSPTNRQYERFTRSVRANLSITAAQIAAEVEDRKAEDNLLRATLTVQAGQIAAEVSARERDVSDLRASLNIQAGQISAEVEARNKADESIRATLNIHAQEIEARVTKEGGDASSFSWKLTATGWSVYGNGSEIFGVDRYGAYVKGEIRATTGKIGNWDINSNYLSYNGQTWGGTNTTGAYIGQSGIQLGNNFRVDMQGNLSASSGTFSGNVYAGNIQYGGNAGYFSGGGLSGGSVGAGKIVANSLGTGQFLDGVKSSLDNGDYAANLFSGVQDYNASVKIGTVSCKTLYQGGNGFSTKSVTIKDYYGKNVTIAYWGW